MNPCQPQITPTAPAPSFRVIFPFKEPPIDAGIAFHYPSHLIPAISPQLARPRLPKGGAELAVGIIGIPDASPPQPAERLAARPTRSACGTVSLMQCGICSSHRLPKAPVVPGRTPPGSPREGRAAGEGQRQHPAASWGFGFGVGVAESRLALGAPARTSCCLGTSKSGCWG